MAKTKKMKKNVRRKPKRRRNPPSTSAGRTSSPSIADATAIKREFDEEFPDVKEAVVNKLNTEYHRSSLCLTSMAWGLVPDELVEAE